MEPKSANVLVTSTSFKTADPAIRESLESWCRNVNYNDTGRPYSSKELRQALADVDGYIAGVDQANADALSGARRLKVIARYGVGTDNVDLAFAREHGITVTNTPGANAVSVAELTIGLLFSLLRSIPHASQMTKAGDWPRTAGISLRGKTVGIVGLGAVGQALAARLAPFECRILGFDPNVSAEEVDGPKLEDSELDALLSLSDIVTLHVPGTPETRGMANRDFFGRMKVGSFLINTARGDLVDESSLIDAIESGRLRGAALDVFSSEPPSPDNRLLGFDNVVATPHMAAHSDDAVNAMARMAVTDCLAVLQGRKPRHPVV